MSSPCQNCPYRKLTCHDRCKEYNEYHDALVNAKRKLGEATEAVDFLMKMHQKRERSARIRK